jgi:hypothetical protein
LETVLTRAYCVFDLRNYKMPRTKGNSGKAFRDRVELVNGRVFTTVTLDANGVGLVNLTPDSTAGNLGASSPKLASISDVFQYYRFSRLRVLPHLNSTTVVPMAVGFCPALDLTGAPTNLTGVLDMPWSTRVFSVPIAGLAYPFSPSLEDVPKANLMGNPLKWFRTRQSASIDDEFEIQGQLWIKGLPSSTSNLEVEYWIEVKSYIAIAFTPKKVEEKGAPRDAAETSGLEPQDPYEPVDLPRPLAALIPARPALKRAGKA